MPPPTGGSHHSRQLSNLIDEDLESLADSMDARYGAAQVQSNQICSDVVNPPRDTTKSE